MHGNDKAIWSNPLSNEFRRLAQGIGVRVEGTNTMYFIPKVDVPFNTNKFTYPQLICNIRPNKAETYRTRLTVGGNLLDYDVTLTTPTAIVTTAKCIFNIIVYTPSAKCLIADIKTFYLNNDLPQP